VIAELSAAKKKVRKEAAQEKKRARRVTICHPHLVSVRNTLDKLCTHPPI